MYNSTISPDILLMITFEKNINHSKCRWYRLSSSEQINYCRTQSSVTDYFRANYDKMKPLYRLVIYSVLISCSHFVPLLLPFQRGDRLYTSESNVYRRQILTYKGGPRTEKFKIFIMVVDVWHRYSSESEPRHLWWFQLEKPFGRHGLYSNISAL